MTTTRSQPRKKARPGKRIHTALLLNDVRDEYIVYAAVPGMQREDIQVNIQNSRLTVCAAKKEPLHCYMDVHNKDCTRYRESLLLPADADTLLTAAVYRNGELQIHIPKGNPAEEKKATEIFVY
jgi:HSP20 family molecular chaperone IbpA